MEKEIETFISILAFGGFWTDFRGWRLGRFLQGVQYFRVVLNFFVTLTGLYWLTQDPKALLLRTGLTLSMGIIVLTFQIFAIYNESEVQLIVQILREMSRTVMDEADENLFQSHSQVALKLFLYHHHSVFLVAFNFVGLPLIFGLIHLATGHLQPLHIPLALESFFLQEDYNVYLGYLVSLITNVWVFILYSANSVMIGMITFTVCFNIAAVKLVKRKIKGLTYDNTRWNLEPLVKKHQYAIRLNSVINSYLSFPFAMQNGLYSITICMTLFNISKIYSVSVIQAAIYLVYLFKVTFVSCMVMHLGERLKSQCEELFEDLCGAPWGNQRPSAMKDFSFVIAMATDPLKIEYKGMGALNHETGLQIFNAAYSYFMILKNTS